MSNLKRLGILLVFCALISFQALGQDSLNVTTEAVLYNSWGYIKGMHLIDENSALLTIHNHGIALMEFNDTEIEETNTFLPSINPGKIIHYENVIYAQADNHKLLVLDIDDPTNPQLVNTFRYDSFQNASVADIKLKGEYLTVFVNGGYGSLINAWHRAEVHVYSLEDPANPDLIASAYNEYGDSFETTRDVTVMDSTLLITLYESYVVVPIEDDFCFEYGTYGMFGSHTDEMYGVHYQDGYLYVSIEDEFRIYEVNDEGDFDFVSMIELPNYGYAIEDEGDNILLYGNNYPAIIYDLSTPGSPQEIFRQPFPYNYKTAKIHGDRLIGSYNSNQIFGVYDITDLQNPEILVDYTNSGNVSEFEALGQWAVFVHSEFGVSKADLTVPSAPVITDLDLETTRNISSIQKSDESFYALTGDNVHRFNISGTGEIENHYIYTDPNSAFILDMCVNENEIMALKTSQGFRIVQSNEDGSFSELELITPTPDEYVITNSLLVGKIDESLNIYSLENPENITLMDVYTTEPQDIYEVELGNFTAIGSRIFHEGSWYVGGPDWYGDMCKISCLQYDEEIGFYEYDSFHRSSEHYFNPILKRLGRNLFVSYTSSTGLANSRFYIFNVLDSNDNDLIATYRLVPGFNDASLSEDGYLIASSNRWLQVFDAYGLLEVNVEEPIFDSKPVSFQLHKPWPNPFNPSVNLSFTINNTGLTKLSVYNLLGQKVATLINQPMESGSYSFHWNAQKQKISSGTYYVRLQQGDNIQTQKIMLMK